MMLLCARKQSRFCYSSKRARDFFETPAYELAQEVALNGASDPVIEREPLFQSKDAVENVDSAFELKSPEILRTDRENIVPEAAREKLEAVPALQLPAATRESFEIPLIPASERAPSRPAKSSWARRAAVIAVALFVVAMAIWLSSALRDARSARHQRDIAQAEQSRTERINSFLQRILSFSDQSFTSIWPVARKRNVTVIEMLDRTAPQVQTELADEPEVRGEMLRMIGKAYASQGQHDAAEKNLRAALQTQTAFYGEQNAEVTETMIDLGVLLYRREKFAAAELFLEKGVIFLRKQIKRLEAELMP